MKLIIQIIILIVFCIVCIGLGKLFIFQTISSLLFGWMTFLGKVMGYIVVNPLMIVEAIIVISVLIGGMQWFLLWVYDNYHFYSNRESVERKSWKLKWTITGISIFLLMFITSISITGLIHQAGWLAKSPLTESSWGKSRSISLNFYGRRTQDILIEIGNGLQNYYKVNKNLPIVSQPVPFKEIKIPKKYYNGFVIDQWGMPILYSSDGNSYILRSYGKNQILGGGIGEFDDLLYSDGELFGKYRKF